MIKVLLFATAARRVAGNWRHLWGRTGQIVAVGAVGAVGYYGFTTIEESKIESVEIEGCCIFLFAIFRKSCIIQLGL